MTFLGCASSLQMEIRYQLKAAGAAKKANGLSRLRLDWGPGVKPLAFFT
jgi:hypothetical protein